MVCSLNMYYMMYNKIMSSDYLAVSNIHDIVHDMYHYTKHHDSMHAHALHMHMSCCRYIGNQVTEVDRHLVIIAPPQSVERAPRSIEKHRQYWKGDIIIPFALPIIWQSIRNLVM